ncbi:MAG: hypothetical protein C4291_06645 [Candidatus Dadabacteria bacterium]
MIKKKLKAETITEYNRSYFVSHNLDLQESRLKKAYGMILEEKPGFLLDIGCGKGDFSSLLIKDGWKVWGTDLDSSIVCDASGKGLNAVVADVAEGLPFEGGFFDCVFAGEIVEHLVDTDFFIKEVYRVLKKGGSVIITTPNLASFENRIRILLGIYPIWVSYSLEGVGHIRAYTPRALKKQLMEHGFTVEKHKGNWVPFIPQRFADDVKYPLLAITGDLFPNLSMDIIIKARKN